MVNIEMTPEAEVMRIKFYGGTREEWMKVLGGVKSLQGARFNSKDKTWIALKTDANIEALSKLGTIKGQVGTCRAEDRKEIKKNKIFSRCPAEFREWAKADEVVPSYDLKERQAKMISEVELNGTVIPGLRGYQKDFLRFMELRGGRAILADDMGTGKTVQSLSWLAYSNSFPALIVVTAPTKLQWEREYHRWLAEIPDAEPVEVLKGRKSTKLYAGSSMIINWDILSDWEPILSKYGFKCIIGDEAQAIGNPNSKRGRAFLKLAKKIPQCIVMSGTPARSKPSQYWPMISCVEPTMFPNYQAYKWRYCDPQFTPFSQYPTFDGITNAKELHSKLMHCMLRRTKQEIMTELPSKQIEVIPLEVDESMRGTYEQEENNIGSDKDISALRLKVSSLGRTAYLMKEKALKEWASNMMEETGEKVIIFCWHRDVVDLLEEAFKEYNPAKIYGQTTLPEREVQKDKFINDDSCKVIIGNIQALGTGIDGLQKVCCKAIFAEFPNTATDAMQAEDRLHRGGQENQVTIYYTCAKDTIDEDMMAALDNKRKTLDSVLDGKETDECDLLTEILARCGFIR